MPQHEFEGRLLHLESLMLHAMDLINNLSDQIGKLQQDTMMTRTAAASMTTSTGSRSAVVTTPITAAPDANTLGEGVATIRTRGGALLSDWFNGAVYSNFSTEIAAGTRIEVVQDGSGWKLVAADGCGS